MHIVEKFRMAFARWLVPWSSLFWLRRWWGLRKFKRLFDTVEKTPLTLRQREAILLNEKRNLIIAGAGTGKTSSIVGKIGYLTASRKARPEEILVLAFNRDAAAELKERISSRIGVDPDVLTFHALGNSIIRELSGRTRVSDLQLQPAKFGEFLNHLLDDVRREPSQAERIARYFSESIVYRRDEFNSFNSLEEYTSWIINNELITFSGERVKSYGELIIANYLFCEGIEYQYEEWYQPNKPISNINSYRPDFRISDINGYIEYFGIDEKGNTAPYIERESYNANISWKRELHAKGATTLLEIAYHEVRDGVWRERLDEQLSAAQVPRSPRHTDEILRAANAAEYRSRFLNLVAIFLPHFKSNGLSMEELKGRAGKNARALAFIEIFGWFFVAYEERLRKRGEIDFNDMINQARDAVQTGRFSSPWTHIIIDEFQDISSDRYRLIDSLLKQRKITKLFCVGDDWQSIYRFAGSDITLMTAFGRYFGPSHVLMLDETFRFNDKLALTSENFIQANPRQIRKQLRTRVEIQEAAVSIVWSDKPAVSAVLDLARELSAEPEFEGKSLQVLARYNHDLPRGNDLRYLHDTWPGKVLEPKSCHASKGLEADVVILSDLISGKYGFPSEHQDDPLLNLVLAEKENYPHAEERRLMYVAMTRARHKAFLISDPAKASEFAIELSGPAYFTAVRGTTAFGPNVDCPMCKTGKVVRLQTGNAFCSNRPVCKYRARVCERCENAPIIRGFTEEGEAFARCADKNCDRSERPCPKCEHGILIPRKGRFGAFYGCHLFEITRCPGKG